MRAACALRISSGRIILNLQCWKICGFSSIAFSQEGVVTGNGISAKRRKKAPEGGLAATLRGERVMDFYLLGFLILNATAM